MIVNGRIVARNKIMQTGVISSEKRIRKRIVIEDREE